MTAFSEKIMLDIFTYFPPLEISLKLQGKNKLVCDLHRIIKGFLRKRSLFEAHLEGENFSHFHCFREFCALIAEDVNLDFPKKIIRDMKKHFLERFSDLDKIESEIVPESV